MKFNIVLNGTINKDDYILMSKFNDKDTRWIGIDKGAIRILKSGFNIHASFGDFDSVTASEFNSIKKFSKNLFLSKEEKDQTDFELALDWLIKQKQIKEIKVFAWNGGRFDQLLANLSILTNPKYKKIISKIVFWDVQNILKCYLPGKWIPKKIKNTKYIGFYTLENVNNLTIKNFKYELKNKNVRTNVCYSSNEFLKNKKGTISFTSGFILEIQTWDLKTNPKRFDKNNTKNKLN